MGKKEGQISNELQQLGGRMEEWRKSHTARRRLPEELWEAAVGMARKEGIYRTARALRLDYANLKRRIETTAGKEAIVLPPTQQAGPSVKRRRKVPGSVKRVTEPATFVELVAGAIGADCLIEVEGRGGRMRIQMKLTAPEVMNLVRDWRERQA